MPGDAGPYAYDADDLEWFDRFTLRPADPEEVRRRFEAGEALATMDLPSYLARPLTVDADTGLALYRLVQLFGTPNVAGLEAGADQPDRELTTWQYLFEVTFESEEDDADAREFLLSVYDYKTDVSTGLSTFLADPEAGGGQPRQPARDPPPGLDVPDDEFLVGVVQLVLNTVEEPVPATFKDLWV